MRKQQHSLLQAGVTSLFPDETHTSSTFAEPGPPALRLCWYLRHLAGAPSDSQLSTANLRAPPGRMPRRDARVGVFGTLQSCGTHKANRMNARHLNEASPQTDSNQE